MDCAEQSKAQVFGSQVFLADMLTSLFEALAHMSRFNSAAVCIWKKVIGSLLMNYKLSCTHAYM